MSRFLPPAALQGELARAQKLVDQATGEHEKAVEAVVRAQARLEHSRHGAAAKQEARDASSSHKAEVEEEMQAAKFFAEYFASVWERKEAEVADATAAVHRSEVELKQASSTVEAVRKQTVGVMEAKEDADAHLVSACAVYEKVKRKVDEAEARARQEAERQQHKEQEEREAAAVALQAAAAAAAAKAAAASGVGVVAGGAAVQLVELVPSTAQQAELLPFPGTAAAGAGDGKEAASPGGKRSSGSHSRSRSRDKQRRRSKQSRSRDRDRGRRRSGKDRSRSRSRDMRRSNGKGRSRSRSRSRDKKRSGPSNRREQRDGSPAGRGARRGRSPAQQNGKPPPQQQEEARRQHSRSRSRQGERVSSPRVSDIRVPRGLQRQFEDALRGCLEAKRLPFNCSFINDRMKRQDSRWNVQSQLGCSFSQLCQVMQREGMLQLKRQGDTWEVVSSRLEQQVRQPPARMARRLQASCSGGDERWVMG